jgi:lysophospholipase L1-like esterase
MPPLRPPDDETPVKTIVNKWLWRIMMPAAIVAWSSSRRWTVVLGATLATPFLAILQGAFGILSYRIYFRDAPIPMAPSHGVVAVRPGDKQIDGSCNDDSRRTLSTDQTALPKQPPPPPHPVPYGGGCSIQDGDFLKKAAQERPVRILVIGDSLAIGVGQAQQSTPIMPEVIAKTLSKLLGGRVVYWTCHGAPGASAGWLVRELERGLDYLNLSEEEEDEDDTDEILEPPPTKVEENTCSETDESSSDESSTEGVYVGTGKVQGQDGKSSNISSRRMSIKVWRRRLVQHQKRFDPHFLGPYDIAVVLTGSNDLKSACFPFLLTGEDVEFRRQAKARGGNYSKELRILLETLNTKMQVRLHKLRESVEAATETVRERVEETIVRIAPATGSRIVYKRPERDRAATNDLSHERALHTDEHDEHTESRHFPLVVLPGMPARALPKFQKLPLRWLAVPVVDIMDMHKRNLAKSHPGQVLFVPAPSLEEIDKYENQEGDIWKQRCSEDTALNVRAIKTRDRHRIEGEMRKYFGENNTTSTDDNIGWLPFAQRPAGPGSKIFSKDRIHPNDTGYDFWGRYIANAINEKWEKKQM